MAEHEASPGISSVPLHWRVRVCRWLWRALGFVWGTLIVGIVITTIANLSTTTTDTPLAKLYIIHLGQTYPLLVWLGLGFLTALTLLSWLGSRDKRITPARLLSEQERFHILRRLRMQYEQILAQSLQGVVQLELGLASRPDAVHNAIGLALRLPAQPEQSLPPHTSIVQAYELAQQELLILGEPGAGKSTLLVELARTLLAEAEQDATRPLPILLPLASWAARQRPLSDWLSEEIIRLYNIPCRLSPQWIAAEQFLFLLDGLDEMEHAARPVCIAAINTYHHEHLHPLVICSRTSEYDVAAKHERIALHTAVVVQPLEPRQVDAYLMSLGKPLAGLRRALKTNPVLRELATTPLMLQVLMLTYHGTSVRTLSQQEASLRRQIWADYVQRMVERKGDVRRYSIAVTTGWLRWLAYEMHQHNQTVFFLETLQPIWLPMRRRSQYQWSVGLLGGLLGGLLFGLLGGGVFGLVFGLVVGLPIGLSGGLPIGPDNERDTELKPLEILTWSLGNFRSGLVFGLVYGLLGVWTFGLLGGLLGGLFGELFGWLLLGSLGEQISEHPMLSPNEGIYRSLKNGPFGKLFDWLLSGFFGEQISEYPMLSPNEGIHRSLKNGLVGWLLGGLAFGLLGGLLFGLVGWLLGGLAGGLGIGLVGGLGVTFQHYLLRFWLAQSGAFPWQAIPFLEDATARILLRRVGGGYSFVHRLLLDYFADLNAQTPLVQEVVQMKSPSVQTKT